jgi:hypothetical protein
MPLRRDRARADGLRAQLLGPRRYELLSLDEIIDVGRVLTGDPQGMAFYQLAPVDWYARGIRLLGRTLVEATPDVTAGPLSRSVQRLLGDREGIGVVDPFVGSGNLMFHVARSLSATACGLDIDEAVWAQTLTNLRLIGAAPAIRLGDWLSYFDDPLDVETTVYVLSPPWGDAFSYACGLDIARTNPPIPQIVDTIAVRDHSIRCYAVIQHSPIEPVRNVSGVTDRYRLLGSGRGCLVIRIR